MDWREVVSRVPRKVWLALLAVSNLIIWTSVAVAVALLASDMVDIGVESFIRQSQATAVSAWENLAREPGDTQPESTPSPTQLALSSGAPQAKETSGAPAETGGGSSPEGAATQPAPAQQETTTSSAIATPLPTAEGPGSDPDQSASQGLTPAASSLLLLTDPDWTDLAELNEEMGRSAVGRPVQVRLHEDVLNERVKELLGAYPSLPFENVEVDLKRDGVEARGDVGVLGFPMSTKVSGNIVARDCRPAAEVEAVSMAGVLTPGIVSDGLKESLLSLLSRYPEDHPLCVEQIVIEEDRVTIYGSRR
jgi:hypothetical protein